MTEPQKKPQTLKEITKELGEHYSSWKSDGKKKDELKDQFFELVTAEVSRDELAERIVTFQFNGDAREAFKHIEKYNAGWDVATVRMGEDEGQWEAILVENPEYRSFTFVNPVDEMVYTKNVVSGSIMLDDERLREEDPELYKQVTYIPEPKRQLRNLDELSDNLLKRLREYIYEGKPTVKLNAPRKAKPEELDG